MKSTNIFTKKLNFGFTLIELVTALVIFTILALVGLPAYQEYKIRSHMAEAESVVGTMERHSVSYLLAHGSFYSAAPNPASVPGIDAPGAHSEFNGGNDWQALGLPISEGSSVVFSFQAFAGQSAPNGTPVINDYLHSPTENMNLERGRATTSTQKFFPHSAGLASLRDEALRFDFSDFHFFSFAADEDAALRPRDDACLDNCVKLGGAKDECAVKCRSSGGGEEDLKTRCYNQCGENMDCFYSCYNGKSESDPPVKTPRQVEEQKACEAGCAGNQQCMIEKCGSSPSTGNDPKGEPSACDQKCGSDTACRAKVCPGETGQPKDDFNERISCNTQCHGDQGCVEQCMGGDKRSSEGNDHAAERCRHSCGGDKKREQNCINGNDDGDNDDIAHQCCRARCGNDRSCLEGCSGNSCESACRGNQSCIANCRHGSCEASCHGDHRCIQRCGQQNCQHTCGGNRQREEECNNDNENEHDTCVSTCVRRGGNAESCRRQCDTNGGHDCPRGQSWNGTTCAEEGDGGGGHDCPSGQTWNGTSCISEGEGGGGGEDPTCPSGTTWNGRECATSGDGGGGGSCPAGTTWNGTQCISTNSCPSGAVWDGERCVTPDDHVGGGSVDGECASFGVSTPKDFGVPEGVPGVDFVVFSAVGNFKPGNQCTLVVKVIQARDKKPMRSAASIVMNRSE